MVMQGLVPSREIAQRLIMADRVRTENSKIKKPGDRITEDTKLKILEPETLEWVSRGGHKLVGALNAFSIDVKGKTALDVGASTGGFTHVLLEQGAKRVFAIDVGKGQLDVRIARDGRVTVCDEVNVRYLTPGDLGPDWSSAEPPNLVVMDLSFIGVAKVVPAVKACVAANANWIILIKPQFEAGETEGGLKRIGSGGIVRSESDQLAIVEEVTARLQTLGLRRHALIKSPIKGTKGNQEYLGHFS
jgi:23S rRNA (cytidine1920-2'-O)/16S rRNA (cytidine1409-2'-O)-methyltransferase